MHVCLGWMDNSRPHTLCNLSRFLQFCATVNCNYDDNVPRGFAWYNNNIQGTWFWLIYSINYYTNLACLHVWNVLLPNFYYYFNKWENVIRAIKMLKIEEIFQVISINVIQWEHSLMTWRNLRVLKLWYCLFKDGNSKLLSSHLPPFTTAMDAKTFGANSDTILQNTQYNNTLMLYKVCKLLAAFETIFWKA